MDNRPVGRKKNVTEGGSGVHRRGEGQASGPVSSTGGAPSGSQTTEGGGTQRSGGRISLFTIILILLVVLGGGGGLSSFLGGGQDDTSSQYQETSSQPQTSTSAGTSGTTSSGSSESSGMSLLGTLLGGYGTGSYSGVSSGSGAAWSGTDNTGRLNTNVAASARPKRTAIKGGGDDTVTIMVYMCGADLESKSGMASRDLQEMLAAQSSDKVNLIIYTGGAKQWQNNVVSSSTNQIYQIKNGKLNVLEKDAGKLPMTKPDTLSGFIKYAAGSFPANRNILVLWDHGGGSTGGYGYDEKFTSAGAMSLGGINKALKDGGVSFDIVGFDTCLMATVENALLVSNYADYLVASEETEPGVGWYYTDWLTALAKNTSLETLQVGKIIIDTFTEACAKTCPGQKTTLSMIDLCELSQTVPSELTDFARTTSQQINSDEYRAVSNARSSSREFASNRIDQVDLVDFANKVGTDEARELTEVLLESIKYNRTSANMTNAYGLSIYFPYRTARNVDSMVDTYEDIGMDEEYAKCIQSFASLETAGQVAAGGTANPVGSLFGDTSSAGSGASSAEMITELLSVFLSSDYSSVSGLSSSNTSFLGRSLDVDRAAQYIAANRFDSSALFWTTNADGDEVISLPEDQWALVQDLQYNMFYEDGDGYVNLGTDNILDFDDDGNLKAECDKTWISIDGQVVAYNVVDVQGTSESYVITGRVPCELNGVPCNLILVFDSANEDGYVAGANYDYVEGQTQTIAKNLTEINVGDEIDFKCDYYTRDGKYDKTYYLGEKMVVDKPMSDMLISNTYLGDGEALLTYRFTDIYGQNYWTSTLSY